MGVLSHRLRSIGLIFLMVVIAAVGFLYLEAQNRKLTILTVDAGARASETHFLMRQFAEVVERHSDLIRLSVLDHEDQIEGAPASLSDGIDLATIQSHTPAIANTHLVAELYEDVFQIITRTDTDIYQVKDLNGKMLALPPHGSAELAFFWAIGDHYDLFVQNVQWASMSEFDAIEALLTKRVDAVFLVGSPRHRATLKLIEEFELTTNSTNLRMLAVDQAPAMGIKRPYIEPFFIEKGTFDGDPPLPNRRLMTGAVRRLLVASSATDPDHVAELTRVLFENRADLSVRFPLANRIKAPDLASGLALPLHEGAEQYYTRDEPSFIQENAEPLALLVTVFTLLLSGLIALRSRFAATQKNVADRFNYDVLEIGEKVRAAETFAELSACRDALREVLDVTVVALDKDDVTDEGFQSFAFLWKTVNEELDEKIAALETMPKQQAAE